MLYSEFIYATRSPFLPPKKYGPTTNVIAITAIPKPAPIRVAVRCLSHFRSSFGQRLLLPARTPDHFLRLALHQRHLSTPEMA